MNPERIADPRALTPEVAITALVAAVGPALEVRDVRLLSEQADGSSKRGTRVLPGTVEIAGRLRVPSDQAYEAIAPRFRELGYVLFMRRRGGTDVLRAVPGALPQSRMRLGLAALLFAATLLSVLSAGVDVSPEQLAANPLLLLRGWPFAASLLSILLAHELGHFVVARRLGVAASLPYFIPFPLSILGTMGAVIQLKAPPRNKRDLLAVAVAGPLAGLAVAIPVLLIGLRLSPVLPIPADVPIFQEGNSLLYAALKILVFGRFLPAGGEDVFLHPVALAGWAGLLVTSLNLIPAGQLDGGHVVHALIGGRARKLTYAMVAVLLGLSILWQGWLLWAALVFLFGRFHTEPLDDITGLRWQERALAAFLLIVFVLVFMPIPFAM